MTEPNIALLRRNGAYSLALTRLGDDNQWWATNATGKPFRFTTQQFIWETGMTVVDADFPDWLESVELIAAGLNLEETWKIVSGEVPGLSLTDLAELVWASPIDDVHIGALLLCLYRPGLQYFKVVGVTLIPLSEEEVASQIIIRKKQQETQDEEDLFVAWLGGTIEAIQLTVRQLGWLDLLRRYAMEGDSSEVAKAAREWLRRVQQTNDPRHLAFDLLVRKGQLDEDEFLTLGRLSVPTAFAEKVLEETERLKFLPLARDKDRQNLLEIDVFTIDEASTADIDDGLSVTRTLHGYEIGVHIADATAFIPTNSLIEDAARERMTSLYFPEVTLPMLPKQLSEEAGSLLPGEIRPAVSLLIHISETFELRSWEFCRSLVRSSRKLSYDEADAALADPTRAYGQQLQILSAFAQPLRAERLAAGALEMDRPELKVRVDHEKNVAISVTPYPTPARRLVAEFMVLTNNLIGKYLLANNVPAIYRIQDPVTMDDIPDTSINAVRQFHILRRIKPSSLSVTSGPHALIGVEPYAQGTSPLRRYTDLINQRQLTSVLSKEFPRYGLDEINNVIFRAEATLRDLGRAETERQRYWVLKLLANKTGEVFDAVVLDTRDRGYVVEIEYCLIRSNVYLRPTTIIGTTVQLVLQGVDMWRQQAYFIQVD